VKPPVLSLPDRLWLRVADPAWADPLDASFSARSGGRWNAPGSFPVLYLSIDPISAQLQIERLLAGTPFTVEDLDDAAFDLIVVALPPAQRAANLAVSEGLAAVGLPPSYPRDAKGKPIPHRRCQSIGAQIHQTALNGIWCRSAVNADGRELAWFVRKDSPRIHRKLRLPLGAWRHARDWSDLRLQPQALVD
jgi:RES domain-containing protein